MLHRFVVYSLIVDLFTRYTVCVFDVVRQQRSFVAWHRPLDNACVINR